MGRGRRSRASISRNAAMQEPSASARDKTAAAEVTLDFRRLRQPSAASAPSESSQAFIRRVYSKMTTTLMNKILIACLLTRLIGLAQPADPRIGSILAELASVR